MENTLPVTLSRQSVLQRQMDAVATNLANVNTAGYKAEHMIFSEFLEPTDRQRGPLSMVHDVTYLRDVAEGPLTRTNNPLDLAVHGDGFFAVETPEGPRYTRHGTFQLDEQGRIATLQGQPVLGTGDAPIVVPADTETIDIAPDGTVSADTVEIGQLSIVTFDDARALAKEGDSLLNAEDQLARPAVNAEVRQGMIEGSNVKAVLEMTRMIDVVRSYQSATRLAEGEHQRILKAIDALVDAA